MYGDGDLRWKIGNQPGEVQFSDLVLVSLHHVSMDSWQPHLRLRHSTGAWYTHPAIVNSKSSCI
jgi:hypothetical protein